MTLEKLLFPFARNKLAVIKTFFTVEMIELLGSCVNPFKPQELVEWIW